MPKFGEMSADEQKQICNKLAECLKANDLASVPVTIYREEVAPLGQSGVEGNLILKVTKSLPSTQSEKADKFKEEVKSIIDGIDGIQIQVSAVVGPGDMYKTITNVTTLDAPETPVSIDHNEGEVLMIDFWATWCPPCQAPMAHNQKMLEENGANWGDKVKIIGLSIDNDAATVKKHITAKGWEKPIHYWRSKSDCSDVYSVKGVPHVMLIDTNGKIAFKGHPANRPNLAEDLTNLLKGETLSGEGCGAAATPTDGGDPKLPEGYKEVSDADMSKFNGTLDSFKESGKQIQEECKEQASAMQRAFCVMVLSADLNPATMKWAAKFENYRVLVGSQASIDHCLAKIKEKVGSDGGFEVVERTNAI